MTVLWWAGIGIAAIAAIGIMVSVWWWVPKWQMRSITASAPKERADIEDNFRKTIGQGLGGIAVLIGAGTAYYGTLQTLQVTEQQARRSQQSARDLLVSNQVAKGFEQLANDNRTMRLGGIYALEAIMNDRNGSSNQYQQPILEAFGAFVRDSTTNKVPQNNAQPETDIQATLTVLTRRRDGLGIIDLSQARIPFARMIKANLTGANLSGAVLTNANLSGAYLDVADMKGTHLSGALLDGANLSGADLMQAVMNRANLTEAVLNNADLREARLSHAVLTNAKLSGAYLTEADLSRAIMGGANLSGAYLDGANLSEAILVGANLRGADLSGMANLSQASLHGADLREANLSGANLRGAYLDRANLSTATGLSQTQLDNACGEKTKLPPSLTIKPCPTEP